MSPTSSEFRRTFAVVIVALVVACGVLFAVSATQGPKLSSSQADVAAGTLQQLRLVANQPVASVTPEQVSVEPAAPFTVDTSGAVIAVRFTRALDYATDYTVTVSGVRSPLREVTSTLTQTFSTGAPTLFYLKRDPAGDSIYRAGLHGADRTVVYTADGIQEFAVTGGALAVVTLDGVLSIVGSDGGVETVPLPAEGTISLLHASDSGSTLGFVLNSDDFVRTLFTIDLASGRELAPVLNLTGEPQHVLDWQFVPGTESLIAQDIDRSVTVVTPGQPPLPLGDYLTLSHVSADGAVLTASDAFGFVTLGVADLDEQRIEPSPVTGVRPFGGEVQALADGMLLQHVVVYNDSSARFDDYLVTDDGTSASIVFGRVGSPGSILSFQVSPNEQYVAIEIDPNVSTSVADGYSANPRPASVTTLIVAIATGSVISSFEGFDLSW